MKKRLLAMLLVVAMVLSYTPSFAMATETAITLDEFVANVVAASGTYDGNGVVVKITPESGTSTENSTGNVPNRLQSYSNPDVYYAQYQRFAALTDVKISNVNFIFVPAAVEVKDPWNTAGATTTAENINGELQFKNTGAVELTNCNFSQIAVSPINASSVKVTGCAFENLNAYAIKDLSAASVSVTGTTFTNCNGGFWMNAAPTTLTVEGNEFTDVGRRGAIQFSANGDYSSTTMSVTGNTVTGGALLWQLNATVTDAQLAGILANNEYTNAYVEDSTYAKEFVAQVGNEYYETLEEAIEAGGEVTLLTDVEITTSIKIQNTVAVDLNGKTLTGPDDGQANWYAFIVDGGALTLKDSVGTGELYAKCYGVETKSGSFTMDSGKITATKNGTVGTAIVNYGGTVTVNGGTIAGADNAVYTGGYFSDAATTIKGGTINGVVTVEDWADKDFTETVTSASNAYNAVEGCKWEQQGDVYVLTFCTYVAEVGETKYETLEEAIEAGGEVKLLTDVEITTSIKIKNTVIVDLNGKTLTGPDDGQANWYAFIVDGGALTLKDSVGTGELYAKCYGVETKSGSFTMDSGKITATKNGTVGTAIVNYGGTVTVNNGTLEGANGAVYTGGYFSNASTTINGGTISGVVIVEDWTDKEYTETVTSASNAYSAEEGYKWEQKDGVYVLTACDYVAQITVDGVTTQFTTLQAAIDAAFAAGMDETTGAYPKVVLIEDTTEIINIAYEISEEESYGALYIDMSGHTLSGAPTDEERGVLNVLVRMNVEVINGTVQNTGTMGAGAYCINVSFDNVAIEGCNVGILAVGGGTSLMGDSKVTVTAANGDGIRVYNSDGNTAVLNLYGATVTAGMSDGGVGIDSYAGTEVVLNSEKNSISGYHGIYLRGSYVAVGDPNGYGSHGGTISGYDAAIVISAKDVNGEPVGSSTLYVKNGVLKGTHENDDLKYAIYIGNVVHPATVTIEDGTFIGKIEDSSSAENSFDFWAGSYSVDPTDFLAENKVAKLNTETGYYEIGEREPAAYIYDMDGNQVGSAYTLAEAIKYAQDGQIVSLNAQIMGETVTIDKNITLDLNYHNITGATEAEKALVNVTGATVSIVGNGQIMTGTGFALGVFDGANVSLYGVGLSGGGAGAAVVAAELYVGDCVVESGSITGDGIRVYDGGLVDVFDNANVRGGSESGGVGIDAYDDTTVIIEETAFVCGYHGVYLRGADVTTFGTIQGSDAAIIISNKDPNKADGIADASTLTVNGGMLRDTLINAAGNYSIYIGATKGATVTLTGGEFEGNITDEKGASTVSITGGTYHQLLMEGYVAEGYVAAFNGNVYTVSKESTKVEVDVGTEGKVEVEVEKKDEETGDTVTETVDVKVEAAVGANQAQGSVNVEVEVEEGEDEAAKTEEVKQALVENNVTASTVQAAVSSNEKTEEHLSSAAESVAQTVVTTDTVTTAVEKLTEIHGELAKDNEGNVNVQVEVKPYLDVDVKNYQETVTEIKDDNGNVTGTTTTQTLTMHIEAKYDVVATVENGTKSAVVSTGNTMNTHGKNISITVPLPMSFVNATHVYVRHYKDGVAEPYNYTATVDKNAMTATFDNPHGFSEFELYTSETEQETDDLAKFAGTSMVLEEAIDINFWIDKTALNAQAGAYATVTFNGVSTTIPMAQWTASGNYHKMSFQGVAAKEMCDEIQITVYAADGTAISQEFNYTVGKAIVALHNSTSDADMKELCTAMLNYGAAAQKAFNYKKTDLATKYLSEFNASNG